MKISKGSKKALVPRLRFPDFAGEWTSCQLIDVADKKTKWSFIGGPFGSNLKASDYEAKGIRIIQLQNIGDGSFKNKVKIFTSKEKAEELLSNNIFPGDIIISKMGDPVGRACIIPDLHDRYVMCSDGIRLVVDEEKFAKYFVYSLINSAPYRKLIESSSTGSTRKRIGLNDLRDLPFPQPQKRIEQQKIADCLSSLDGFIMAETELHAALQDHKKGLMQQLFPAESQTTPKRRFPEFEGEWDDGKLSDYSTILRGGSPRPIVNYMTEDADGLNWLKIGDLNDGDKYVTKTKEKVIKAALQKTRKVLPGDLIMANSMSFGQPYILAIKACIHDGWIAITKIKKEMDKSFLYYLIYSEGSQRYFQNQAAGGGVRNLNADIIKLLPVVFCKLAEQQKIVACLTSLDELITVQSEKIEALKDQKKGLLQQLFPSTDLT